MVFSPLAGIVFRLCIAKIVDKEFGTFFQKQKLDNTLSEQSVNIKYYQSLLSYLENVSSDIQTQITDLSNNVDTNISDLSTNI